MDTGSLGASLTLEPPAVFKVSRGSCPITINSVCIEEYHPLAQELARVGVSICGISPVPLGVGSAVSGALAIALAYSYLYLREGISPDTVSVGKLAHRVELETGGGLGDVICQMVGGGLVLRRKQGPPGIGEVVSVPVRGVEVTLGVLGNRISTREMLLKYADKFVEVGSRVFKEFLERPDLDNFLRLSREFSIVVGFMSQEMSKSLSTAFKDFSDRVVGYFVKKSLLVVVHEPGIGSEVSKILQRFHCYSLPSFKPARQGFTVSL